MHSDWDSQCWHINPHMEGISKAQKYSLRKGSNSTRSTYPTYTCIKEMSPCHAWL